MVLGNWECLSQGQWQWTGLARFPRWELLKAMPVPPPINGVGRLCHHGCRQRSAAKEQMVYAACVERWVCQGTMKLTWTFRRPLGGRRITGGLRKRRTSATSMTMTWNQKAQCLILAFGESGAEQPSFSSCLPLLRLKRWVLGGPSAVPTSLKTLRCFHRHPRLLSPNCHHPLRFLSSARNRVELKMWHCLGHCWFDHRLCEQWCLLTTVGLFCD